MSISGAVSDVGAALVRAIGPSQQAGAAAAPAAVPPGVPRPAPPVVAPAASEPTVAASTGARVIAYVLLVAGLALAILVTGETPAFMPKQGFVLFTGFYVAAQAVERLLEFVLPPGGETAPAKADRSIVVAAIAFVLGIALSLILGLRFLSAVQVGSPPRWLDVFVTGLVIAGGTKPLHDLIGTIEKAKTG